MSHISSVAQLGNNYVYCVRRPNNTFIYDIYGFNVKIPKTKYEITFKNTIHLQLYEHKKKIRNITLLRLQHNCIIFGIDIVQPKKTLICIFRFRCSLIVSKHLFKTEFNSNQVSNCNLVSNILLFDIVDTSNNNGRYYALFAIQKDGEISVGYIRSWHKNILNPLIVISPSIIHPRYQLSSCLKSNNNNNNNNICGSTDMNSNIIWNLSLCIPESYLRYLICITPNSLSLVQSNYMDWYWWISVQRPGKECKILLIKNRKIMTRIPFLSEDNIITPLSLISVNCNTVLFISQTQHNDNDEEDDDDDIDMDSKTQSFVECHIIKRDSFQQHKCLTHKKYKQWFGDDDNNGGLLDIYNYKPVYRHEFEKNRNLFHYDAENMILLYFSNKSNTFKIYEENEDILGFVQWNFQSLDIKKLILHKIPKFFENPLNSLKVSYLKQLQKCFELRHRMISQFNNQLHSVKSPLINDEIEILCVEWNSDSNLTQCEDNLVIKLPFSSNNSHYTNGIILSCPYIRFTAFSMNFNMESPTKFMQSMAIGDFMSLNQDLKSKSLMINMFEANTLKLEHLAVFPLSLEQLNRMKCNSQNMHFYDGLQQKEINGYLNKKSNDNLYDGWVQYFNKFVECFEKELEENVTKNENNFYQVLRSRLCSSIIPVCL